MTRRHGDGAPGEHDVQAAAGRGRSSQPASSGCLGAVIGARRYVFVLATLENAGSAESRGRRLQRMRRSTSGYVSPVSAWRGALVATEAVAGSESADDDALVDLVPMLRRVVGARIKDPHSAEDLVQETLTRVMSARSRVAPEKLPHYASRTARNLMASYAEGKDRARSRSHLLVDDVDVES